MKFSGLLRKNQKDPIFVTAIWSLGGLLAIFIPLITWSATKGQYYNRFGKYQAMQQQEEMEAEYQQYAQNKEQNDMNSYWNNMYQAANYYNRQGSGDGSGDGGDSGDRLLEDQTYYYHSRYQNAQAQEEEQGTYYYRMQQQQKQQQQNSNIVKSPSWYNFLGGKKSSYYGNATSGAATPFVYAWSLVLFVALIAYGAYAIYYKHSLAVLAVALAAHLQYTFLLLLLLPQGVMPSPTANGAVSDPYAFYNSASMLMVYTYFSLILFDAIALIFGGIKVFSEKIFLSTSPALGEPEAEDADIESECGKDYRKFDKLEIQ